MCSATKGSYRVPDRHHPRALPYAIRVDAFEPHGTRDAHAESTLLSPPSPFEGEKCQDWDLPRLFLVNRSEDCVVDQTWRAVTCVISKILSLISGAKFDSSSNRRVCYSH